MGRRSKSLPANPLADKIAAEIEKAGGRLIINPERFAELARECNGR